MQSMADSMSRGFLMTPLFISLRELEIKSYFVSYGDNLFTHKL